MSMLLSSVVLTIYIKLRESGYRLFYKVEDDVIIVTVLAVGKRERSDVYNKALKRLED